MTAHRGKKFHALIMILGMGLRTTYSCSYLGKTIMNHLITLVRSDATTVYKNPFHAMCD